MIPNFADPDRCQAVRWTAIQAIHALENLREGRPLLPHEAETLRTLSDDMMGISDWTRWIRDESIVAGLFADTHRVKEALIRDASGFSSDETAELRKISMAVATLADGAAGASEGNLDAIEDACGLLITRLETRSEYVDAVDTSEL